ncbi:MAG: hypothetical protein ACM369_01135, partial [Acidobacteriota bacterium]
MNGNDAGGLPKDDEAGSRQLERLEVCRSTGYREGSRRTRTRTRGRSVRESVGVRIPYVSFHGQELKRKEGRLSLA